jgi:hypothetical protein
LKPAGHLKNYFDCLLWKIWKNQEIRLGESHSTIISCLPKFIEKSRIWAVHLVFQFLGIPPLITNRWKNYESFQNFAFNSLKIYYIESPPIVPPTTHSAGVSVKHSSAIRKTFVYHFTFFVVFPVPTIFCNWFLFLLRYEKYTRTKLTNVIQTTIWLINQIWNRKNRTVMRIFFREHAVDLLCNL